MKFSIRAKLISSSGLLIIVMAIVGWRGIAGMQELNQTLDEMYTDQFFPARTVADANIALIAWNRAMVNHIVALNDEEMDQHREGIDRHKKILVTRLESLAAVESLSQKGRGLMQRINENLAQAEPLKNRILALSREHKVEEAKGILSAELRPIVDEMDVDMSAFLALQENQAADALAAADARYAQGLTRILWIVGIALVGSLVVAYVLASGISTSVNEIVRVAEQVAEGDLEVAVSADSRGDEIGDLARSFRQMVVATREMVATAERIAGGDLTVEVQPRSERDALSNALAEMVRTLRGQIREIVEGANVLASATSEILASTTQLASSSAEGATAVSETTTTVEEVKQTAQLSAQKAGEVADRAGQVKQTAENGRQATEEAMAGMTGIREQMKTIAERIVGLSEQSQTIGEIIATVDDLAEQSNLLAVNASIEAARAGEEGKGFAVVAEEIKALAEQSKQATGQVRSILSEIQKATGGAVMAAEQGSKAVETGVGQSTQAGEAIRALSESVAESAQTASQIAASSQQQMAGVEQVVLAMESIQEASAQNAASTQQVEASARNLDQVGQRLKELVAQYEV